MATTQIRGNTQIKAGTITNTEIASSAGIDLSKLAEAVIQADGGQAFTADQSMGGFKLTNLSTPTAGSDAATKSYVDTAVTGLLDFKGGQDCSANPNYPSGSKGDAYVVTVAGKIGGASGRSVDVGDVFFATADNAGGTEASVGANWDILEHNLVGALLSANNLSDLASPATALTNLGGSTVGKNIFTAANPSAIRFLRVNADNSVDLLNAADFRTAIGVTGGTNVKRETPSGTINGSNTDFTLANTPIAGTEEVFLNGVLQDAGSGNDYQISGAVISFATAPLAGSTPDKIRVNYTF
jgi:hypothetical protein